MKVHLASVSYPTAFTFHRKFLSLGYLHAHALSDVDLNGRVSMRHAFYDTRFEDPAGIAERIASAEPDLVGFSCYVWNTDRVLQVVEHLKRIAPGVLVVLGGPQVEEDHDRVLETNAGVDFVSVGEGEETFRELLRALLAGRDADKVLGLARRVDGGSAFTGPRPPSRELDRFPSPYLSGVMEVDEVARGAYLQTTRGCPYRCAYCDYGRNRPYSEFSLERVAREIEFFRDHGARWIFCVDATFNQNNERAVRILDIMVERSLESALWFEAHPNLLDERFVEAVGRITMTYLGLGIQTTNPVAMKHINRVWEPERIDELLEKLALHESCHLGLEIIMGLPGDNLRTFKDSITWLYRKRLANANIFNLQVVPGTELYREMDRFGIVKGGPEWSHEIVSNNTFPADQIQVGKAVTHWNNQMQPVFYRLASLTGLAAGELIEGWAWHVYHGGLHDILPELDRNRVDSELLERLAGLFEQYCAGVFEREGLPDLSRPLREFMRYFYSRRAVTDESAIFFESMDVNCITFDPGHNRIEKRSNCTGGRIPDNARKVTFGFDMERMWPLDTVEAMLALEPETHTYCFFADEKGAAVAVEL